MAVGVVGGAGDSSALTASQPGPGDNAPCLNYTTLTEGWRRQAEGDCRVSVYCVGQDHEAGAAERDRLQL